MRRNQLNNFHFKFSKFIVIIILLIFALSFLKASPVQAATPIWNGGGVDGTCGGVGTANNWSCGANWSTGSAPALGDTVTFNGTSTKNATIDAGFQGTIATLTIASGYTGTITMARSLIITSTFTQSAGSFTAANQALSVGGTFLLNNAGASFTASSATTTFSAAFSITAGTFNNNSGTIDFSGGAFTIACNNNNFFAVNFTGQTGVKTFSACPTVAVGASPTIPNGITLSNSTMTGSGTLTMTAGVLTLGTGAALTTFTGFTGTTNGLTISGATFNMGSYTTAFIGGNLTISSGSFTAPSGTLTLSGLAISGSGSFVHNNGTLDFSGSAAGISCNGTTTSFNNVNFTGQTGVKTIGFTSACKFNLGASPTFPNGITLTNGSILMGSGTLTSSSNASFHYQDGASLSGFSGLVVNGSFFVGASPTGVANTALDLSTYTTVDFNNAFTINTPTGAFTNTFTAPTGNMTVAIGFTLNTGGTFVGNGGTLTFDSNSSATITCASTTSTFGTVVFAAGGGTKTVSSNCTLPLGNNPTMTSVANAYNLALSGVLTGTGTLTLPIPTFSAGASLNGFTDVVFANNATVSTGTMNFSSMTSLTANGTFTLNNALGSIILPPTSTFNNTVNISAGSFTASSGTTTIKGSLTITGTPTFNANGGTFDFSGAVATLTCAGVTFNQVNFVGQTNTKTISNGCNFNIGSAPIISKNIILSGTLTGSGTILVDTGATLTLNSGASIATFSGLDIVGALVVSGATVNLSGFTTITGSGSISISSGSLTLPNGSDLNGSLAISGGTFTAPSGSMTLAGNFTVSGSPVYNSNNGTITFDGGTSTIDCGGAGIVNFQNVIINSTGTKTIKSTCVLPLGPNPDVTRVVLYGTLSGSGVLHFTSTNSNVFYPGYALIGFSSVIYDSINTNTATITRLLGTDQGTYYQTISGVAGNSNFLGAYNIKSVGSKLFFLWNSAIPDHEASHFPVSTVYDGSTFTKISSLTEDDATRQKVYGNKIFIPGRDPSGGDDWDAGNLYTINTDTLAFNKMRYRYGSDHFVDSTTTDSNGNYSFNGLKTTSYTIKFIKPANYVYTTEDFSGGLNNIDDSNANVTTGSYTECQGVGAQGVGLDFLNGFTEDTVDAGLKSSPGALAGTPTVGTTDSSFYSGNMNIGDKVWSDTNGNGKQDPGEPGLAGVRVELYTKDPYFPCVIHSSGFTEDGNGNMYYSGGFYYDSNTIFKLDPQGYNLKGDSSANVVFKSTDNGVTWSVVNQDLANYEAKDLTYNNGNFYEIFRVDTFNPMRNYSADTSVVTSPDGLNWVNKVFSGDLTTPNIDVFQFGTPFTYNVTRRGVEAENELVNFKGKVITTAGDPSKIVAMNGADLTYIQTNVDKFGDLVPSWFDITTPGASNTISGNYAQYSTMVSTGDSYLYSIGSDNKLYITSDLRNFTPVADFAQVDSGSQLITLGYWSQNDELVASTIGSDGNIYTIPQNQLTSKLVKITNPNPNLSFTDQYEDVNLKTVGSINNFPLTIKDGTLMLSDVNTNLSSSCSDWSTVDGASSATTGKSYIKNLNLIPCNDSTHNLYIPIPTGEVSNNVMICPDAQALDDISYYCSNGVEFANGETKTVGGVSVTVSLVTVDSQNYWLATGVSGTGGESIIQDTSIPSGSMIINNGSDTTNNPVVTLSISASDNDPQSNLEMQISEDYVFSGAIWEPYSTTKIFTLSSTPGEKHLYIRFRDFQGNISLKYGAIITLVSSSTAVPTAQTPTSYAVSYPSSNNNNPNEPNDLTNVITDLTSSNPNVVFVVVCCLLLLALMLIVFVLRRNKRKNKN